MRLRMGKLSAGGDDYDNDGDLIDNDVDNEDDNGDDGTPSWGEMVVKILLVNLIYVHKFNLKCECVIG